MKAVLHYLAFLQQTAEAVSSLD